MRRLPNIRVVLADHKRSHWPTLYIDQLAVQLYGVNEEDARLIAQSGKLFEACKRLIAEMPEAVACVKADGAPFPARLYQAAEGIQVLVGEVEEPPAPADAHVEANIPLDILPAYVGPVVAGGSGGLADDTRPCDSEAEE